jgi:cellulose synthase/poly-beta-1,6-N-acetylglucosamine synthase-like glycosyltransferase
VIIATVGRPDVLDRCLSALATADNVPHETVVVDNTSGDPATQMVAQRHGARCLTAEWTGLSGARNAGIRASTGPIVAFLDDDAAPTPGWLSALLSPFADTRVMAVTGRVVSFEAEAEARRRVGIAIDQDLGPEPRVVSATTPDWFEICNFGGLGIGANMAFRRESLEIWPGFRESLGRGTPMQGGEEHNAFFELVRKGYKVAYAPEAVARHRYPHTLAAIRRTNFRYLAGAAAYATLLVVEEPRYRRRTLRYMFEALLGRKREWRLSERSGAGVVLPRAARLLAYLCGPPLYLLSLAWVRALGLGAKLSPVLRRA